MLVGHKYSRYEKKSQFKWDIVLQSITTTSRMSCPQKAYNILMYVILFNQYADFNSHSKALA